MLALAYRFEDSKPITTPPWSQRLLPRLPGQRTLGLGWRGCFSRRLVDRIAAHHYGDIFARGTAPNFQFVGTRIAMVRKKLGRGRKNRCRFCTKDGCPRPAFVDYKDVQGL